MATLKAPFNFVPLSDKVYFPDWADKISHDIPFSDGISGIINLKITAESRIFVRNGHTQSDHKEQNETFCSFSKDSHGRYFIPGSSIKGSIRNVLEIMSLGKITNIQNQSFGIRDLSKSPDGDFYRDIIKPSSIHCGWMTKQGEDVRIEDCGHPWRISVEEIDRIYHTDLEKFVKENKFIGDRTRTAQYKYEMFKDRNLQGYFEPDEELRESLKIGDRQFVRYNHKGEAGTIVFTGQPGARKMSNKQNRKGEPSWTGKYFEFVFPTSRTDEIHYLVDSTVFNAFESIHNESPDYKDYWKKQLYEAKRIPVFFRLDENDEVESIGTAYMYKYPAYNTVFNAVRYDEDFDTKYDLAECIFGSLNGDYDLKGRVQFGHAFIDKASLPVTIQEDISLSTPHASYYPYYVGNGKSWNSDGARIAGFKRYPIRNKLLDARYYAGTEKMTAKMSLLEPGISFNERICFHNLRPIELGAILAALTFDGHAECRHNLGAGKPIGFGKVHIEIVGFDAKLAEQSIQAFHQAMEQTCSNWSSSSTMQELIAMAQGIPEGREEEFVYMHMDNNRDKNEFLKGKEAYARGEQLGTFTQILYNTVPQARFAGNTKNNDRVNIEKELQERREQHEKKLQEEQRQREKFEALLTQVDNALSSQDLNTAEQVLKEARQYVVSDERIDQRHQKIEEVRQSMLVQAEQTRQAQEKEAQEKRVAQRVQDGLACLEEIGENGQYKVKDLKVLTKKVEQWMKAAKVDSIPSNQQGYLAQALSRIYGDLKPRDKAPWTIAWADALSATSEAKKGPWTKIIEWVGAAAAEQIYSQVVPHS